MASYRPKAVGARPTVRVTEAKAMLTESKRGLTDSKVSVTSPTVSGGPDGSRDHPKVRRTNANLGVLRRCSGLPARVSAVQGRAPSGGSVCQRNCPERRFCGRKGSVAVAFRSDDG